MIDVRVNVTLTNKMFCYVGAVGETAFNLSDLSDSFYGPALTGCFCRDTIINFWDPIVLITAVHSV